MNLDDKQKKLVAAWINDGLKLSEIQQRIGKEFGLSLTYMDVRFLVDDLRLLPKDPPPPEKTNVSAPAPVPGGNLPSPAAPISPLDPKAAGAPAGADKVSVSVDALARPGSLVSGSVNFSDGQTAAWYVDQFGRMAVAPKQAGYKPAPADMQSFQLLLEQELSKMGL